MAGFEDVSNAGGVLSDFGNGISSLTSALFGSETDVTTDSSKTASGTKTKQLQIDEAGIQKILADILGSEKGLASIFSKEQVTGLYDSTVAAQAGGDLATKLAGEIAKLQAKEVTTEQGKVTKSDTTNTEKAGLFDFLGL